MAKIKLIPASETETVYYLWCPGCNMAHAFNSTWQFNGDLERPTAHPSLLVRPIFKEVEEDKWQDMGVCHSFVRDGKIQFLGDSWHALKGQTVDLPDYPEGKF